MLEGLLGTLVSNLQNVVQTVINFLPGSPFQKMIELVDEIPYMAELNWFLPVSEIITVMEIWLAAVSLWLIYQGVLRIARLVQ